MLPEINNSRTYEQQLAKIDELAYTWRCLYPKDDAMRHAVKDYDEDFLIRMAYNSNAIEGSTLTLADTEVVYEGEFVPDKPGREQIAARGIFEGSAYVDKLITDNGSLNESHLRDLHEHTALDLQPAARGAYRTAPAIIRASRTTPASPLKIRDAMANLFYQYDLHVKEIHPLIAIAWFHASLEAVHPFADGNGRTGRIWMNAQLRKRAYPPISIKVDNSREYKKGLEAWQVDGRAEDFIGLFFDCCKKELTKRIEFLSQAAYKEEDPLADIKHGLEILGILFYQPAITAKEVAEITYLSERQVQRILKQLSDKGFIARMGPARKGTWIVS